MGSMYFTTRPVISEMTLHDPFVIVGPMEMGIHIKIRHKLSQQVLSLR